MTSPNTRLALIALALATVQHAAAADSNQVSALRDAEYTYECRLERVLSSRGAPAMFAELERDFRSNPKPYVKAWYANWLIYGESFGMKQVADPKRGFQLAKEAAAEGSLFGVELVGRAYGDGIGPGYRDVQQSVRLLTQAADEGRGTAQCELSKFYFFGIGVPKDRAKAISLARAGAGTGATMGLDNLADWLDDPRYAGTPDHAQALALRFETAELGKDRGHLQQLAGQGDKLADVYAKLLYVTGAKVGAVTRPAQLKSTIAWLEENSGAASERVQLAIADLMIEIDSPVYNPTAAKEKLTRLAANGNSDAQAILAEMKWRGIGQKTDAAGAIALWREAAATGNARSIYWLGALHWWFDATKYGIQKDATKALELTRQAADRGDWRAQFNLALCYNHGIGTEKSYDVAAKYYGILARRGYLPAIRMRDRLLAELKD